MMLRQCYHKYEDEYIDIDEDFNDEDILENPSMKASSN